MGRHGSAPVVASLRTLIPFLQARGLDVVLDSAVADLLPDLALPECPVEDMGQGCDLVVVVGGDGSMLRAARALAPFQVPVLGINRGNLGFLTDILPSEIEQQVEEVLAGRYRVESRFMLEAAVSREGERIGEGRAMNEVMLHPGETARMMVFALYIDGEFVYNQRSDGLIMATPTGSTAYALSAGGPIMHPHLDAMVLVPMFPHTLSSRPIVVDGNARLKLVLGAQTSASPHLSCDSQQLIPCEPGDEISVHKSPHPLRLVHPLNYNFYETCRSKLGWGTKLGE